MYESKKKNNDHIIRINSPYKTPALNVAAVHALKVLLHWFADQYVNKYILK